MAGATNAENRNDRVLKGRYLPIRTFPSKPHLLKRPGDLVRACVCIPCTIPSIPVARVLYLRNELQLIN